MLGVLLPLSSGHLYAQEVEWRLGIGSGLVERGVALGQNGPSLRAAASYYGIEHWFVAASVAKLKLASSDREALQVVTQIGRVWPVAEDWDAQLDYSHYGYPFDNALRSSEHDEVRATFAYRNRVLLSVSGVRRLHVRGDEARLSPVVELATRWPLQTNLAVTAGIGYEDSHRRAGFGYVYGQVGAIVTVGEAVLQVAYVMTDNEGKASFGAAAADRWTLSATWRF